MATHDYNIANQIGSEFRADLNNALLAIVSNNSNASAPSTTYAYQLWVDTANNVLKLRNSANNAWITTGISITASNSFTGDITGNSATATALATARTINGVSFDGTANISFNTDSVSEGSSNLYFTNERVDDQVNSLLTAGSGISLTYDDAAGTLTIANTNSADITSVVAGDGLTGGGTSGDVTLAVGVDDSSIEINSDALRVKASGVTNAMLAGSIANSKLANSSVTINSQAISLGGSHTFDSDDIGEGSSNLYFTNARARGSLSIGSEGSASGNGAIAYNSSTGVFTYTPPVISGLTGDTDDLSEGSSNLYYTDARANSAIDARVTNTFINNLSGVVADTATALATARSIALSGDVTASGVNFDGTGDITLSTTIAANSVALGTDTTGNYVATVAGTTNEIEVSGSGSETAAVTIGLPDNVTIAGNLTVNGTTTSVNTQTLEVEDPLIKLAKANSGADSVDIGFYGLYDTSGSQDLYAGLFRDASDSGKFKLFKDLQAEPTTTVNTSGTGYAVGTLVSNLEGDVTGNVTGNVSGTAATVTGAAQTNITSLGTLTGLTTTGDINLGDDDKVLLGASSDLQIFHDGSDSFIKDEGQGNLRISSNGAGVEINKQTSEYMIRALTDGAVELYHNNSKKLETTSSGVDVTGTLTASTNLEAGSSSFLRFVGGSSTTPSILFGDSSGTGGTLSFKRNADSAVAMSITATGTLTATTLAGTLSTAAQPNITSVGSLSSLDVGTVTSTGNLVLNQDSGTIFIGADLDMRILHDGSNGTFRNDTGNLTIDVGGDIFLDADGGNIKLQDGGVVNLDIYKYNSNVYIENPTGDSDIIFQGTDGSTSISALTLDMSNAGAATFNNTVTTNSGSGSAVLGSHLDLGDNQKARFGAGDDLEIYHDSSDSYIKDGGTGNLLVQATHLVLENAAGDKNYLQGVDGDAVSIYYNGSTKLATTSSGVDVTGTLDASTQVLIGTNDSIFAENNIRFKPSGGAFIDHNTTGQNINFRVSNSSSLDTTPLIISSSGITVAGNIANSSGDLTLDIAGDIILDAGGGDWKFKDDGTDIGLIANSSSDLIIQSMVSDKDMIFRGNDGGSTIVALTLDMSDAGKATFNSGATFGSHTRVNGEFSVGAASGRDRFAILPQSTGSGTIFFSGNDGLTGYEPLTMDFEDLKLRTSGTERMRITSGGLVGIGMTPNSGCLLNVNSHIRAENSAFLAGREDASLPAFAFHDDTDTGMFNVASNILAFSTAATERMRIDSSGKIGIGTTSPSAFLTLTGSEGSQYAGSFANTSAQGWGLFVQAGADNDDYSFRIRNKDATDIFAVKSGGLVGVGTATPNSYNSNGDNLVVAGSGNTGITIAAGTSDDTNIFFADGTSGDAAYRGIIRYNHSDDNLEFYTAATERMTIDSSGNLGLGTDSPNSYSGYTALTVNNATTGGLIDLESNGTRVGTLFAIGQAQINFGTVTSTPIVFLTDNNERMRIDSSGHVLINCTAAQGVGGYTLQKGTGGVNVQQNSDSTSGGYEFYVFRRNSTQIGSINQSSTNAVTYNTSSDARLKDVTGSSRGLDVINNLNPVAYNWKADNHSDEGLIAQEVEELVPNAVNQDEDGYYSMDYSKLVTHLVKGMQEQQEQIESLKSEIAKLNGE